MNGDFLKTKRKNLGLSQIALGDIVGVSGAYIQQLEKGLKNPSIKTLKKIANALGVSVNEIMDIDTSFSPTNNELLQSLITNSYSDQMKQYISNVLSSDDLFEMEELNDLTDSERKTVALNFGIIKELAYKDNEVLNHFLDLCELLSLEIPEIDRMLLLDNIKSPVFKAFLFGMIDLIKKES